MRAGTAQTVARPAYYDRAPTERSAYYASGGVAPHSYTTRASYTCPVGKKAYVEALNALVYVTTAAAPAADRVAYLEFQKSGGSVETASETHVITNVIGDHEKTNLNSYGALNAGDLVQVSTADSSTGGTMRYILQIKAMEFDA